MSRLGVIGAVFVMTLLWGCEFIPGTAEYQEAKARSAVAQTLIDPSSAQFRNVTAREGAVCGEINGKNRMGAYAGFVRFYVETSSWTAVLDPQFDPQNLLSAMRLCSSLTGYDSTSCARQAEEEAKQALQRAFNSFWLAHCTTSHQPASQLPFDPTGGDTGFENEAEAPQVTNGQESNLQADSDIWYAPPNDQPLVDADGNPIDTDDNRSAPVAPRDADAIDQNWLDRAIGRTARNPESNQAETRR
jgi:hypothetical protein